MLNIRAMHSELYTPIYDKFLLASFDQYAHQCYEVFTELEDSTKSWSSDELSGLGRWDDTEEGAAPEAEDPVLGYPKTFTHTKKTKLIQASFEAVDDDEYYLLKKTTTAEEFGRGLWDRVEYDTAQTILGAFSVAGPDGQFLYDTDHPQNREQTSIVYDNLLTGAFSHDNLETAETQISANYFDMKGIPIPMANDLVLLHPPALRGPVKRVLSERAMDRPGTTNRDINRFVGAGTTYDYKPVEWIYLGLKMGGTNTNWHIINKKAGYLKMIWRKRPQFNNWVDEAIQAYNWMGWTRYSQGADNWRFGFGSTGLG